MEKRRETNPACAPGNSAFCFGISAACLAFDARVHDVVAADCACVHVVLPRPQRNRIPLFDLKHPASCSSCRCCRIASCSPRRVCPIARCCCCARHRCSKLWGVPARHFSPSQRNNNKKKHFTKQKHTHKERKGFSDKNKKVLESWGFDPHASPTPRGCSTK